MRAAEISCEQFLGDLRWLVGSPSLVTASTSDFFSLFQCVEDKEVDQEIFQPNKVKAYLESHPVPFRVGIYFESLLHFYLLQHPLIEDVVRGMRLFDDRRTIGELDFLFGTPNGKRCHLETAVKFYLRLPSQLPSACRWVGPNASDNFDKKWKRLLEHQLPLSGLLEQEVSERFLLLRGRLFWHIAEPEQNREHFLPQINQNCLTGRWLYASEREWLTNERFQLDSDFKFQLQRKPFWLSPAQATAGDDTLMSVRDLQDMIREHFRDSTRPLLVSVLGRRNEVLGCESPMIRGESDWMEIERIFVVHDRWPQP